MIPRFRNRRHAGLALGFKSGLEEANNKHLVALGITPVQYEAIKVRYVVPLSFHTYTPDFLLPNGIIVETKGRFLPVDRAKQLLVKEQYPDLDIRLVFSRAKAPIATGSKTTCAQWAEKHGYTYAEKLIPEAWANEQGPERKPQDVLKEGPKQP